MSCFDNHKLIKIIKSITKYSCPKSINFHLHSTYSDGSLTALEIYKQAIELNIDHYAITDHHSVDAYIELSKFSAREYFNISKFQSTRPIYSCWLK